MCCECVCDCDCVCGGVCVCACVCVCVCVHARLQVCSVMSVPVWGCALCSTEGLNPMEVRQVEQYLTDSDVPQDLTEDQLRKTLQGIATPCL